MKTHQSTLLFPLFFLLCSSLFSQQKVYFELKNNKEKYAPTVNPTLLTNDYSFLMGSGSYSNLSNPISINDGNLWDDPEYTFPIGFTFELYDQLIDSIYLGPANGGMISGVRDTNLIPKYLIIPFLSDFIDRGVLDGISVSPLGYELTGSPGSRILKIEWKNAGFYNEMAFLSTQNDFINFQVWLYEGTNTVEYRYGPRNIQNDSLNYDGNTGARIGLSDYFAFDPYLLKGPQGNPVLTDSLTYISGTPTNGKIYTFYKLTTGIANSFLKESNFSIYPNPANVNGNSTLIARKEPFSSVALLNSFGQVCRFYNGINEKVFTLNLTDLSPGLYFAKITTASSYSESVKIVVQ
jgi:hypothetical protein